MTAARKYFCVIFRPGPKWIPAKSIWGQPLLEHHHFMEQLLDAGKLDFAGPFLDDQGGIAMLTASSEAEAKEILPKAVIPAHYFLSGLTTDVSGLESAEGWVRDQEKVHTADVRRLDSAELTLSPLRLKGSHHKVYYFGNHFEKK